MLSFYDLANLEIDHPQLIIRRYRESDFSQLNAIFDPEYFVWFFTNYKSCREFIQEKIQEYQKANLVMLVIIDKLTGEIIGTSSLYEISLRHKRLEMGSTWLAKNHHGSHYNGLIKYLLLEHLFNKLSFQRVQWKTDALNLKSKAAMTKLGFIYEGTLRRHAITYSGRTRDSLIFAVTDTDWPQVSVVMQQRIQDKANHTVQFS